MNRIQYPLYHLNLRKCGSREIDKYQSVFISNVAMVTSDFCLSLKECTSFITFWLLISYIRFGLGNIIE